MNEPQRYDDESARACLACGHAVPHSRGEYEDTHDRCTHETRTKHKGIDCGHKRYREDCAASDGGECWIGATHCECSEEDRLIADLNAANARLRSAFDELLTQMHGLRNIAAQEVSLAAILSWCDAAIENAEKERT